VGGARALAALWGAIEVLAPEPLRLSLMDYAQQTPERYEASGWRFGWRFG
jgi:hypothetical protein